jgi:type IV secretion system protein TrbF
MLKTLTDPLSALRGLVGRRRPITVEPNQPAAAPPAITANSAPNPYVEARREWNERYGDYIQQAHHWRMVALLASAIAVIAVSGVVYIGAQSKIVPYVVEVDKLGAVAAVAPAERANTVDQRVMRAYIARFVTDWRMVSIDRLAQKGAVDRVYAMLPSGSVALRKLNEQFRATNPFVIGRKQTVAVELTNILPISNQTWQVEWREVTRDLRGELVKSVRMKVSIIVGITPPTDEQMILINPLGVYITDLNWSQEL